MVWYTDLCLWVGGTNIQNVPENVCGHKSLLFSITCKIHTINGMQTLTDLQYTDYYRT